MTSGRVRGGKKAKNGKWLEKGNAGGGKEEKRLWSISNLMNCESFVKPHLDNPSQYIYIYIQCNEKT